MLRSFEYGYKSALRRALPTLKRSALGLFLVAVAAMFIILLQQQKSHLDPNAAQAGFIVEGKLILLERWKLDLLRCEYPVRGVVSCAEIAGAKGLDLSFPAQASLEKIDVAVRRGANVARVTHLLTPAELQWLEKHPIVVLTAPRSLQNHVKIVGLESDYQLFGAGAHLAATLQSSVLKETQRIEVEFDFDGYDWFGPAEQGIALVEPETVAEYQGLYLRQLSAGSLNRQMEMAFPLFILALALILDHARAFAILSVYAVCLAVRSFIPFLMENNIITASWWLQDLLYASEGVAIGVFVVFALEIAGMRQHARYRALRSFEGLFVFLVAGLFFSLKFFDHNFWIHADLFTNIASSLVAAPILLFGFWLWFAQLKSGDALKVDPEMQYTRIGSVAFASRLVLVFMAIVFYGYANYLDLIGTSSGPFKNLLDWRSALYLPAVMAATMLEVGSTSRRIQSVGKQMVEKAMLERELVVARDVQSRMLPPRRGAGRWWRWRAMYLPATSLAGDWFDVRELTLLDGHQVLVVCVVDVTGHGVGSALTTSAISSNFGLWCRACETSSLSSAELVVESVRRIHLGLVALRKCESCTAAVVMIDPIAQKMWYVTAGHPGIIVATGGTLSYLFNDGTRPGSTSDAGEWQVSEAIVGEDTTIVVYTDGVIPPEQSVAKWANELKKELRKSNTPIVDLMARRFYRGWRAMRNRKERDDVTLVAVKI